MKEDRAKVFLLTNAILPIVAGAMIYYLISPDVLFVKWLDEVLGWGFHLDCLLYDGGARWFAVLFARCYGLDMLWAYAFVFAFYFFSGSGRATLRRTVAFAIVFAAVMESLQMTPYVRGTFDLLDMLFECLAIAVAAVVIKQFYSRRKDL